MAIYTGLKKIIVQHPVNFWPLLRPPAERKTDATFSNQFESWLHKKLMPHSPVSFKSWVMN